VVEGLIGGGSKTSRPQTTTMRPALMRSVLGKDAQPHGAVFGALWELDPDLALREELR